LTGSIGARIAEQGWRQGSIVRGEDLGRLQPLLAQGLESFSNERVAVVVSQSCDLTHPVLDDEPHAELLVGRLAGVCADASLRGNLTYGKNPRALCLPLQRRAVEPVWMECRAHARVLLAREHLAELVPDDEHFMLREDAQILARWLAQRYQRVAFPDEFNAMLADAEKKRKKLHLRLAADISGLFVELSPDRDLLREEQYRVNVLALVPDHRASALENVQRGVQDLVSFFLEAGMDAQGAAVLESDISYGVVRRFRPFPLDHLSLRENPHELMPLS